MSSIVNFEPSTQLVFKKTVAEGEDGLEAAPVQDVLKISNLLQDQDVLFRVQTTSPLTYRVKPSNGRIPAGESVSIQVVMIADTTRPDKFLIKYVPISPETPSAGNFIELFKTVEANAQEHRLKCSVIMPDGSPYAYSSPNPSPVQTDTASTVGVASPPLLPEVSEPASAAASMASLPKNEEQPAAEDDAKEAAAEQTVPVIVEETPKTFAAAAAAAAAEVPASPSKTESIKPVSKPVTVAAAVDPRDAKIQSLTTRNQELTRQVEELQKTVAKMGSTSNNETVPPEWIALLNSQTGFPPVLVILIALFSFLVGLLF